MPKACGGGLMQLLAYGNFYIDLYDDYSHNISHYDYIDFILNIYDINLFANVNFIDLRCDNDIINLQKKDTWIYNIKDNNCAINCSGQNLKKIIIKNSNIIFFNCSHNQIHTLDLAKSNIKYLICVDIPFNLNYYKIPKKIIYLDCSNSIDNLFNLLDFSKYKKLKFLILKCNMLSKPLKLSCFLIYLDLTNNNYNSIFDLPEKIEYLILKSNKLTQLNKIENLFKLKYLDVGDNKNLNFNPNNLPPSLKILLCSNTNCLNPLNLPLGLEKLDCSSNPITNLDFLPESIIWLNCSETDIIDLSNLPIGLKHINYDFTLFETEIEKNNKFYFNILPKKIKFFTNQIKYT